MSTSIEVQLRAQAEAFNKQARAELEQLRRRSPSHGYFPQGNGPYGDRQQSLATLMGGYDTSPDTGPLTDAMLDDYVMRKGGNPFQKQLNQMYAQQQSGAPAQPPAGGAASSAAGAGAQGTDDALFNQTFAALQGDRDRARNENLARFDEDKKLYTDLGQRNQAEVANWGIAAEGDLQDQMDRALGSEKAYLASHGLTSSTIFPAFQAENARKLARERQRISEARSDRKMRYDSADTERLGSFNERRDDTGPSQEFIANLALQHGQQQAASQQQQALLDEIRAARQQGNNGNSGGGYIPQPSGYSPWQALAYQSNVNNAYATHPGMPVFASPGITSNRYPDASGGMPNQLSPDQIRQMNDRARRGGYQLQPQYRMPSTGGPTSAAMDFGNTLPAINPGDMFIGAGQGLTPEQHQYLSGVDSSGFLHSPPSLPYKNIPGIDSSYSIPRNFDQSPGPLIYRSRQPLFGGGF